VASFIPKANHVVAFSELVALPQMFMSVELYFLIHELSLERRKMSDVRFEY
jgi:hypothetical protein